MWILRSFDTLHQDIRFAFRTLRKAPGFTCATIAVLAIGIGGNTAIFSLLDAMRARALPYDHPDRLVQLWGTVMRTTVERRGNSYPDFLDWRARASSFVDMAAFDGQLVTLFGAEDSERVPIEYVSAPYFSLLGVSPTMGRTFSESEDRLSAPAYVAVMSDGMWRRRFGADPSILGRVLTLNTRPHVIVGVMPPAFNGLTDTAEIWLPFALDAPRAVMTNRGNRWFGTLARLKPEATVASAQAELDGISRQLELAYPNTNEKRAVAVSTLDVELFGALRPALQTLMAAVAFVLLIACANIANLFIARSEARTREIAVRAALGAGRGRLLRQLVTESGLLTALGGITGLVLARAAVAALVTGSPVSFPSFASPELDARVAAFTIAVSVACGILVGLAPALHARGFDLSGALKEASRGSDGRRAQRLRSGLIILEVSLAVLLLVGAGLMMRSVSNLVSIRPGFDPNSLLTLHISISQPPVEPVDVTSTGSLAPRHPIDGDTLLQRLREVRGVSEAALGTDLPFDGESNATMYSAEGMSPTTAQNAPRIYRHRVSPEFFSTVRIPVIAGRTFTESELANARPVAIVSERVVKRFWAGQDPIGKRIKFGTPESSAPWQEIVGVVGEVKYRGLPDNPTADPDVYLPFTNRSAQLAIAVRATVPPSSLVAPLRSAIRAVDPSIPVFGVSTMTDLLHAQTASSRFMMWLMGIFAAIALALAAIGIYAVMAYLVTQRTREIGIRLALGAGRADIIRLVVGSGARMIGAGIVVGIAGAFGIQRLVASLLFGVTAVDIGSAVAVAILAGVALVACYLPAARATRVDPLKALRCD